MAADEAAARRELDSAILIASRVLAQPVPQGISTIDDRLVTRVGDDIRIIFDPWTWASQIVKTFGPEAALAAITRMPEPHALGRGYVHIRMTKTAPKLLSYWIAQRVSTAMRRDRTPRMRFDLKNAVRLDPVYGKAINRLTRGAVDEPAIAA